MPHILVIPGLSTTDQSTNSDKELIQELKNPGPKNSFIILDRQLRAIDILATLFNTVQPEKTQTKVLPTEVPMIAPLRVPITVLTMRLPETVSPSRVMIPRVQMISQEDTIEDSRQMDAVENNKQQQLRHRYPTKITQLYQEINQVESTATTETRHQHWLIDVHEQVKAASQFIDNCLKKNMI